MMLALAGCNASRLTSAAPPGPAKIVVHSSQAIAPFDHRVLGTNVPAWLSPERVAGEEFRELTMASGTTLLRLPGGSWSNGYDWLGCELEDPDRCLRTGVMRPSDFMSLLESTGLPAMWTVSINGTAQEAAAAVAFFNGSVDDTRPIGRDRTGRDWQTIGHWANLRAQHGHPDPVPIRYWEVGNEVFAAVKSAGPRCASFGWEDVWTCDGTEYVEGDGAHDGFLAFRKAMQAVDPAIAVGAVGVGDRGAWNHWDNKVMKSAGRNIDFYVVHQYGSNGDVASGEVLSLPSRQWPSITSDLRAAYKEHSIDTKAPIAVTEYNLVASLDRDDDALMAKAINAFYVAETIGQMATNGVTIANQWNLANGRAANGSDYGLVDAETLQRSPAYFALALWSRFGDELVAVETNAGLQDHLGLYGGRSADGSTQLLVINPSGTPVNGTVSVDPAPPSNTAVTADVVQATSLQSTSVTWNGSATPSIGLTEPPHREPVTAGGVLRYDFAAYSITLLSWNRPS
jgi:hypothetical protein